MNVEMVEQGTQEWLQLRAGKVTASRVSDVMAKIKNGEAATRRNYKSQILSEILTGMPQESGYTNDAMKWGTEMEPFARSAYELKEGVMVDRVGFINHPTIERAGCSPDGLVGTDGLLEIKCPKTSTHLDYVLANKVPPEYVPQMGWQLACTGRKWVDFVSYDPRLPEDLQLFVIRMTADASFIEMLEKEVTQFISEVEGMLTRLGKL